MTPQHQKPANLSVSVWMQDVFLQQALPSTNVVWGKVIFSQGCVIPSVHRGGGRAWQKRWPLKRGGAYVAGQMATEAGGTHSC